MNSAEFFKATDRATSILGLRKRTTRWLLGTGLFLVFAYEACSGQSYFQADEFSPQGGVNAPIATSPREPLFNLPEATQTPIPAIRIDSGN